MIRPDKYINLDNCVLSLSAEILAGLQKERAIPIADLDDRITAQFGENARSNVLPALSLLFLLGQLRFDASSDVIYAPPIMRKVAQ